MEKKNNYQALKAGLMEECDKQFGLWNSAAVVFPTKELEAFLSHSFDQVAEQTAQALEVEWKENLDASVERSLMENLDALREQSEIVGHNTALAEIEAKKKEFFNAKEV